MSIWQTDEKSGIKADSRYSITLAIPENLYKELMRFVPEEDIEKVIMDGIGHAIRREKCRNILNNQK